MDALNNITPAVTNGVGVIGLMCALFWMLAKGAIVTRREHEGRVIDLKEQNAILRQTVEVKDVQLQKLVIIGETSVKILASVELLAKEKS